MHRASKSARFGILYEVVGEFICIKMFALSERAFLELRILRLRVIVR